MIECPSTWHWRVLRENKREGYCQTAGWLEKEREWRRFKLNAMAVYTATYFLKYGESDDRVTIDYRPTEKGLETPQIYSGIDVTTQN